MLRSSLPTPLLVLLALAFALTFALTFACTPPTGFTCSSDADCADGLTCDLGLAEPICRDVSALLPDAGRVDSGVDAGTNDSGAVDAGRVDAGGFDGGASDGGVVDGGAVDGGASDGASDDGGADGGGADGGGADGGGADGGVVDGGVDGGAFDGGPGPFCESSVNGLDAGCDSWIDFTPRIARTTTPGTFDRGILIGGDPVAGGVGDVVELLRGEELAGGSGLYKHVDANQGTAVAFVTLRPMPDAGLSRMTILRVAGITLSVDGMGGAHVEVPGGGEATIAGVLSEVGRPYFIALRWDLDATISGVLSVTLTVDDGTYGVSSDGLPLQPPGVTLIGARSSGGEDSSFVDVRGLTIYRRVLGGSSGGNGIAGEDELNAIYFSGGLRDPVTVTGAWDVLAALPTDMGSARQLPTGSTHAWAHPLAANLLSTAGALPTALDWSVTSATVADAESGERVLSRAVELARQTSGFATHLIGSLELGESIVVRALAHGDAASAPVLAVRDLAGRVAGVAGSSVSDRGAPDELLLVHEVAAAGEYFVELSGTAMGKTWWHSIDVQRNLLDDGGLESALPGSWTTSSAGTGTGTFMAWPGAHAGASAGELQGTPSMSIVQEPTSVSDGFYSLGAYVYVRADPCAASLFTRESRFFSQSKAKAADGKVSTTTTGVNAWQHLAAVARRETPTPADPSLLATTDKVWFGCAESGVATDIVIDDTYVVGLSPISIVGRAADAHNSVRRGRLRVDIPDNATQALVASPTTGGRVEVRLWPGHEGASSPGCEVPGTFVALGDADNYLHFGINNSDELTLVTSSPGIYTETTVARPATFFSGEQRVVLAWGVDAASVSLGESQILSVARPAPFQADFTSVRFGATSTGGARCPVSVRLPGAVEQP